MFTNPRKTTSIRHLGKLDIAELKQRVLAIPDELWDAENASKPNRFEALDTTRHIVFRFVENFNDWREHYARPIWDEWRSLLEPLLQSATADYGYVNGQYPRVMLARLKACGVIHPHRDANPAARWPHKIHIPITTNDRVVFTVNGKQYRMGEGEACELNNIDVHGVVNHGETDRIHLIFEYFDADQSPPSWVENSRVSG